MIIPLSLAPVTLFSTGEATFRVLCPSTESPQQERTELDGANAAQGHKGD